VKALTLEELSIRLNGKFKSDGSFQCKCPVHDDKKPSLNIKQAEDGKLLFCCYAGCKTEDIIKALDITWKDAFKEKEEEFFPYYEKAIVNFKTYTKEEIQGIAKYIYTDATGNPVMMAVRTAKKDFFQYSYAGDGKWKSGLNGRPPVLYNLPEVINAVKNNIPVFIVEGEKDVETLRSLNLVGTTNPMGAGKWKPDYNCYFKDAKVILLPDNDRPGREHMGKVMENLKGIATLKYIELPGLRDKQDVSDWIQAGNKRKQLMELVKKTQAVKAENKDDIKTFTLKELLAESLPPVKWLVQDILPEGLSLLLGKPKIGKSFLAFNFACAIASGTNALSNMKTEKTGVLYFAIEDHKRRLQDRVVKMVNAMIQAGEEIPDNLEFSLHMKKLQEGGMDQLKRLIDSRPEIKFIIIDTLGRVRKTSSGGNAYEIDTDLIGEVQELCKTRNISILLLHHTKKMKESDYIDDCSGSTGITGSVDTILKLSRNRNEKEAILQVTGRDIIHEQELAISFNDISLSWELLGDAEEFRISKERKEVLDVLRDGQPHKLKEIADRLKKNYNAVKYLCWKLDNEGYIYNLSGYGYMLNNNNNNTNLTNPANPANPTNPANPNEKVSRLGVEIDTPNPDDSIVMKENDNRVSGLAGLAVNENNEYFSEEDVIPF